MGVPLCTSTGLPAGLSDLLLARMERLSAPAQRVLRVAAVAGRHVDDELVMRASGLDAAEYEEATREAVQTAERGGQSAIALRALQDAARLGDARAVQRAQRLAVEVNCVLGRLTLAHARALAAGDAGALTEVAADLADRGMHPAAADASAQAQRV